MDKENGKELLLEDIDYKCKHKKAADFYREQTKKVELPKSPLQFRQRRRALKQQQQLVLQRQQRLSELETSFGITSFDNSDAIQEKIVAKTNANMAAQSACLDGYKATLCAKRDELLDQAERDFHAGKNYSDIAKYCDTQLDACSSDYLTDNPKLRVDLAAAVASSEHTYRDIAEYKFLLGFEDSKDSATKKRNFVRLYDINIVTDVDDRIDKTLGRELRGVKAEFGMKLQARSEKVRRAKVEAMQQAKQLQTKAQATASSGSGGAEPEAPKHSEPKAKTINKKAKP